MAEDESGERNEAASEKRLQQARDEGRVALSREAPTLAVLAATALALSVEAPRALGRLARHLAGILERADALDPLATLRAAAWGGLRVAAPLVIAALLAGAIAVLAQTRFMVNLHALQPDLSRLSPSRGMQRVLSISALREIGTSLLKLAVAGVVAWWALAGAPGLLAQAMLWEPARLLARAGEEVLRVLLALVGAQAAIAGFDILRARLSHASDLRMTRQELRDEHKESEGDPHIKARIRRLRLQRARRRMLQAVPKATVVVTNPTHYAVALVYQRGASGAPRVVAKGMDVLAGRIREVARAHGVPLVANPPLARALYPVEIDAEIPRELFQAVAEIISYIWGLRRRTI